MLQTEDRKHEQAVAWFLNLRDPATADWEGFVTWLESDPAHNDLYEAVALADDDYDALRAGAAPPAAQNDNPPVQPRRLARFAGWSTVAAAVVAAASYPLLTAAPASYVVETALGQRDSVRLDDGTRIDLNGGTRITLHKGDNRFASLDRGEALFTVVHDSKNPFTVHVGDDQIQDVGTVFNVIRTDAMVETAVASGAVVYNPGDEAVRIGAGHRLRTSAGAGGMTLATVTPAEVAAWRDSKLIYRNATLERVAADLSRNLGTRVFVSPDIAARPFSGVIMLRGDQAKLLPRIGTMLDVTIVHDVDGWRLSSRAGDSH